MRRICILALPQVFDSALTITRDVLTAGSQLPHLPPASGESFSKSSAPPLTASPLGVELITVGGRSVHTAGGLRVPAAGSLASVEGADLVLVPGFSLLGDESMTAMEDYFERRESRSVLRWFGQYRSRGGALAAGCTATFLLAEAGLLNGLQATTSWWLADDFRDRYPAVDLQAHMMVTHHDGITCAGARPRPYRPGSASSERTAGAGNRGPCSPPTAFG